MDAPCKRQRCEQRLISAWAAELRAGFAATQRVHNNSLWILSNPHCASHALARIAWPTKVFPSDHMAPGTRSLSASTDSNALTTQSQSASEITRAGSSLIVR